MMSTGYESSSSLISSSSKNKAFYAKIKDSKSAPVRQILERFYEQESYLIKPGETREHQSERVQELMTELETQYQIIH